VPHASELPDFLEHVAGRVQRRADQAKGRGGRGGGLDGRDHLPLKPVRAPEQHLALIYEVPKERPLGQARPFRNLRDRGLVVPALGVEG
jgi:hypothetical protein